jgi:hypothetical protein
MTTWITTDDAAKRLDVTQDAIDTLVGQIADDPALWDDERQLISPTGMELISDQIATGSDPDMIAEVRAITLDRANAIAMTEDLEQQWQATIRRAVARGARVVDVAEAAEITRGRVYQIRDGRR